MNKHRKQQTFLNKLYVLALKANLTTWKGERRFIYVIYEEKPKKISLIYLSILKF